MAEIKSFKATRYDENKFKTPPLAPPYDVISKEEREEIAKEEFNIVKVDKPTGDEGKYEVAKELFESWKKEGVLIQDSEEAIYVYEQEYTHPDVNGGAPTFRRGVYVRLKLESFDKGVVLPHEKTLAAHKVDRMHLMEATHANTSPIFGLYQSKSRGIEEGIQKALASDTVYETYTDKDGTKHKLWKVTDTDELNKMVSAIEGEKVIIADGHHRYETALAYSENHPEDEGAKYILICLVDFADSGLVVLPTHRLLTSDLTVIMPKRND